MTHSRSIRMRFLSCGSSIAQSMTLGRLETLASLYSSGDRPASSALHFVISQQFFLIFVRTLPSCLDFDDPRAVRPEGPFLIV